METKKITITTEKTQFEIFSDLDWFYAELNSKGDFILIKEDNNLTDCRTIIRKSSIIEVIGD